MPGPRPPLDIAAAERLVAQASARTVVLVEGWSDQAAVETLAPRCGLSLDAAGIVVLPIGGATNMRLFAGRLGQRGLSLRLAGLVDAAEARHVLRSLHDEVERAAFFVCDADLEDELIRALGTAAVERVIDAEGETSAFRRFQAQPAQRGRDLHTQLRRFMGTRAGRKIRYGTLLATALDLERAPAPLARLIGHLRAPA